MIKIILNNTWVKNRQNGGIYKTDNVTVTVPTKWRNIARQNGGIYTVKVSVLRDLIY